MLVTLVIHERRSRWARRLRPLAEGWGARLVETRSLAELGIAVSMSACPVVVVDAAARPRNALAEVEAARRLGPSALILAILDRDWPEFAQALIQAWATRTLPASTPPPHVIEPIRRWVDLARDRSDRSGWAADRRPVPEPWEAMLAEPPSVPF